MIIDNIFRLILVSLSYFVLIFGLASIMLKRVVEVNGILDKIMLYFIVGNFYVINIVFLLLFLPFNSRLITIVVLLAGAVGVEYFLNKTLFKKILENRVKVFAYLSKGSYGWHFFRKERTAYYLEKIRNASIFLFKTHFVETILFLVCMSVHTFYIGYRFVYYSSFGISDEPVHLEWVQHMLQGKIFSDGVYPFGMHNIIYAVTEVLDFKAFTVMRYFGFIIAMCMLVLLYILLKKVCRSKYVPIIGLFIYVAANLYWDYVWDRLQYTIPEEFGMLFLYPMCIYLYYYLRDKKQSYLILFGMCFTLTLYVHYYVTIVAFVLCLCVGLSRFYRIMKEKLLLKILLCGLISVMLGILPMGIGMATGHGVQGSLYWAFAVINGTSDQYEENDEAASQETQIPDVEEDENGEIESPTVLHKIVDKTILTVMHEEIFWSLMICMLVIIANTLMRNVLGKTKQETFLQFSILLYLIALIIILNSDVLGIPIIIQDYRVRGYLAYGIPILLCMPFEIVYELFDNGERSSKILNVITLGVIALIISGVYFGGYRREFSRFTLLQSESAMKVTYDIFDEFDDNKWTIVSTVDEYSIVLDSGYHSEWIDFLAEIENYDQNTSVTIPTENIFFFIEKRPVAYGDLITINKGIPSYPKFTKDDATIAITKDYVKQPSLYYINQRSSIMAKAYYWANTYRQYFPNEMTVYYEDENFICYQLKQEPYYLNNLAVDYGYNFQSKE